MGTAGWHAVWLWAALFGGAAGKLPAPAPLSGRAACDGALRAAEPKALLAEICTVLGEMGPPLGRAARGWGDIAGGRKAGLCAAQGRAARGREGTGGDIAGAERGEAEAGSAGVRKVIPKF